MRQTILLADDSPTIQRLVAQTFLDTGFDIISVNNGDAAIRKFEEIHPDVVLADIYMPGKNGFEVCAYIKAHLSLSATPVVLLVGAFDAFHEITATQAGAVAHITKPFEPQALIDLVKSVAGRARNSKEGAGRSETASVEGPQDGDSKAEESAQTMQPEMMIFPIPKYADPGNGSHSDIPDMNDLLGLELLFQPEMVTVAEGSAVLSDAQIDKIAERVIHKLSRKTIESIAWDVVPDIAARIFRDELKRTTHEG